MGDGGHICPPAGRSGEQERKKKWRFKKKRNGVKENEKMAIIKMALTIRVDGAQAESGGDEKRQRKWGNKKRSPVWNSL